MSTLAVDTWRTVNFLMKNLIEVPMWFLPLTLGTLIKQMKTHVLNLKKLKTHVLIEYLTLKNNLNFFMVGNNLVIVVKFCQNT
jgi:uncharacterized protein (DUF362 family)